MRLALLLTALTAFASLGLLDITDGHIRTGIAALLLAVANLLLLAVN